MSLPTVPHLEYSAGVLPVNKSNIQFTRDPRVILPKSCRISPFYTNIYRINKVAIRVLTLFDSHASNMASNKKPSGSKKPDGKKPPPRGKTANKQGSPTGVLKNQDGKSINQVQSQVSTMPEDNQDKPDLMQAMLAYEESKASPKAGDGGKRTSSIVPGTLQGDIQDIKDDKTRAEKVLNDLSFQFFGTNPDTVTEASPTQVTKDVSMLTASRDPMESQGKRDGSSPPPNAHDVADTSGEQGGSSSLTETDNLLSEQAHGKRQVTGYRSDRQDHDELTTLSLDTRIEKLYVPTTTPTVDKDRSGNENYLSTPRSTGTSHDGLVTATRLLRQPGFQNQDDEEIRYGENPSSIDNSRTQDSISVTHDDIDYAPSDIIEEIQRINSTVDDATAKAIALNICKKISEAQRLYEATNMSTGSASNVNVSTRAEVLKINMSAGLDFIDQYKTSAGSALGKSNDQDNRDNMASSSSTGGPDKSGGNNVASGNPSHQKNEPEDNQGKEQGDNPPYTLLPGADDPCDAYLTRKVMEYIVHLQRTHEPEDFNVTMSSKLLLDAFQGAKLNTWSKIMAASREYFRNRDRKFRIKFPTPVVYRIMNNIPWETMDPYALMNHLYISYIAGLLCVNVGEIYRHESNKEAPFFSDSYHTSGELYDYEISNDLDLESTAEYEVRVLFGSEEVPIIDKVRKVIALGHSTRDIEYVQGYLRVLIKFKLEHQWINQGIKAMIKRSNDVIQTASTAPPNNQSNPDINEQPQDVNPIPHIPKHQKAPEVLFPALTPPDEDMRQNHLTGKYKRSGKDGKGSIVWTGYEAPLDLDQLPDNLAYTMKPPHIKDHWGDRIFPGGTVRMSRDGTKVQANNSPQRFKRKPPSPRNKIQYAPAPNPLQNLDISDIQHQNSNSPTKNPGPPGGHRVTFVDTTMNTTRTHTDQQTPGYQTTMPPNTPWVDMGSQQVPNHQADTPLDTPWGDPGDTPIGNSWWSPPDPGWKYPNQNPTSTPSHQVPPQQVFGTNQTPSRNPGGGSGNYGSGGGNGGRQPPNNPSPFGTGFWGQGSSGSGNGNGGGQPPNYQGSPGFGSWGQVPPGPPGSGPPGPPGGGPPGPPGGSPSGTNASGGQITIPKPIVKPDMKAYPKLRTIQEFDSWYKDTRALARAHGLDEVFNPLFRPAVYGQEAVYIFGYKQSFMYATFRITIKPIELRQFVDQYEPTYDAQKVIAEITFYVRHSTHGFIATKNMLAQITNTRLSLKTWNKPTYEFIVRMDNLFDLYNKQQSNSEMRINPTMKRQYMENSLSEVKAFREINDREQERIIMGQGPFNYDQYKIAIKSTATRLDETYMSKNRRDINFHLLEDDHSKDESSSMMEYLINEAKRSYRSPDQLAAQMNKETWTSLSEEAKKIWDELSKEDKAKILGYAQKREERRKAKTHQIEDGRETIVNFHEGTAQESEDEEPQSEETNTSIEVNNALLDARNDAHVGDPRKVLGSDKPSSKNQILASVHRLAFGDNDDEASRSSVGDYNEYWDDQDFR